MHPTTTLLAIYGTPSILLYALMLWAGWRVRKCYNVFWKLLVLQSTVNLAHFANVVIQNRLLNEPAFFGYYNWLNTGGCAARALRTLHFSFYSIGWELQLAVTFLVTFNRYTSIVLPLKHALIWNRANMILLAPLLLVLAIGLLFHLDTTASYAFDVEIGVYVQNHGHKFQEVESGIVVMLGFALGFGAPSVWFMLLAVVEMRHLNNASLKSRFCIERKLLIISIVTFVAMMLNVFCCILLFVWRTWNHDNNAFRVFLDVFYPIVSDFWSLGLPYYTLLLQGPIRDCIVDSFCTKNKHRITAGITKFTSNATTSNQITSV